MAGGEEEDDEDGAHGAAGEMCVANLCSAAA